MTDKDAYEQLEFNAERAYYGLDKRLALMEEKLTVMKDNHLAHIERDIRWMKSIMWTTAVGVIGNLLAIIYTIIQ
jgi:hypothetical protein